MDKKSLSSVKDLLIDYSEKYNRSLNIDKIIDILSSLYVKYHNWQLSKNKLQVLIASLLVKMDRL